MIEPEDDEDPPAPEDDPPPPEDEDPPDDEGESPMSGEEFVRDLGPVEDELKAIGRHVFAIQYDSDKVVKFPGRG